MNLKTGTIAGRPWVMTVWLRTTKLVSMFRRFDQNGDACAMFVLHHCAQVFPVQYAVTLHVEPTAVGAERFSSGDPVSEGAAWLGRHKVD
jgi:hypothetical protein